MHPTGDPDDEGGGDHVSDKYIGRGDKKAQVIGHGLKGLDRNNACYKNGQGHGHFQPPK